MVRWLVDKVCPPRLGRGFRWLLASSWATNLSDGLALAAGPLLVASETSDPVLVAAAGMLQWLPWVLFGLHAGVIADRLDRRRLVVVVNLVRAGVLLVLASSVATGVVDVWVVLGAMFALGTAETLVDISGGTLLPMIVASDGLGVANARLSIGYRTFNQLAGPPIGAFLFAVGRAVPFAAQALLVVAGAVLVARIGSTTLPAPEVRTHVRSEIFEAARWLWNHKAIRMLTLTVMTFNVTFGSVLAIEVLYADQRLGLDAVGFGFLTTVQAVGGISGAAAYGWLEPRLGMANLMRIGLAIETTSHLVLALTTTPAVAMAVLCVFGAHESIWGTTEATIRQRAVPSALLGRVGSIYMLGLMGGLVVGAAIGGLLARTFGITSPFWFAFGGSIVILMTIWRRLGDIAAA